MDVFMSVMELLLMLLILILPGYTLCVESWKGLHIGEAVPRKVRVNALLPFWNTFYTRSFFYGTTKPLMYSLYLLAPAVILRTIALMLGPDSGAVQTLLLVSSLVDVLVLFILYIVTAYIVVDIGRMCECGMFRCIMCIIIPPVGQYLIGKTVYPFMKNSKSLVEDTFLDV